eukprot:Amastigsp_a340965_83.p3 type:complete len:118 gc:universal Amastigsp_a340965_83:302-655(+)
MLPNALYEIVVCALSFDAAPRLHGQLPDRLMELLAVAPRLDRRHQHVLGGHERQLGGGMLPNHMWPDLDAVDDIARKLQSHVGGQERLWENHPPIRRVVERALQPLVGRSVRGIVSE